MIFYEFQQNQLDQSNFNTAFYKFLFVYIYQNDVNTDPVRISTVISVSSDSYGEEKQMRKKFLVTLTTLIGSASGSLRISVRSVHKKHKR